MGEANVVVHDVDPTVDVCARPHHAPDVVMARHVGSDCRSYAVFLLNYIDGLIGGMLVDVRTKDLGAFSPEKRCRCLAVSPAGPNRPSPHH